jgi:hypothetical protein
LWIKHSCQTRYVYFVEWKDSKQITGNFQRYTCYVILI